MAPEWSFRGLSPVLREIAARLERAAVWFQPVRSFPDCGPADGQNRYGCRSGFAVKWAHAPPTQAPELSSHALRSRPAGFLRGSRRGRWPVVVGIPAPGLRGFRCQPGVRRLLRHWCKRTGIPLPLLVATAIRRKQEREGLVAHDGGAAAHGQGIRR